MEGSGRDGAGGGDRLGVMVGDRRGHHGGTAHAQLDVDGRLGLRLRADEAQPVHPLPPVHPLGQWQPGSLVVVPLQEIVSSMSSLEYVQGGPSVPGTQFIDIKLKVVPQLKRNSFCNVNKSFSSTRCTTLYYLRKNTRVHVIVELEIQQNSFSRVAPSDSSTCRISAMWHGRHDLVPLASPAFSAEQPMGGGCARRKGKWAADVDEGAGVGADVCGGSAKMG